MLQQTQVSRVVDKFAAFIERFPTVQSLALADEQDVLGAWTGLGYYRRARNLHVAAKRIVAVHFGDFPSQPDALIELAGVGRYTAGAIASIAFDQAAPIVDGNVARVLLRIHGRDAATDDRAMQPWLWDRAEALVKAARSPGAFNEGLMELGATVCLPPPARPLCERCPARDSCRAFATGRQSSIPRPKTSAKRREIVCVAIRVERADGRLLVEQRPDSGMWAGMWQAPTLEFEGEVAKHPAEPLAAEIGLEAGALRELGSFEFLATHRRLVFTVHGARVNARFKPRRGEFKPVADIGTLGLSTPQRRILLRHDDHLWSA